MTTINLREYYPEYYKTDFLVEVPDEVAAAMLESDHMEAAYRQRTYYHKAYYSLDYGDGIEHESVFTVPSPCEIYEHKVTMEQIHDALAALPDIQAKRIYARFFLGLETQVIAKNEGSSVTAVNKSIRRGLRNMEKYLKKIFD